MNKTQINKFRSAYTTYEGPRGKDGYELAVTYDEKDDVKRLGARWNPAPEGQKGGNWYIKKSQLGDEAVEYLNDNKMIVGPQGEISVTEAKKFLDAGVLATHSIRKPEGNKAQQYDIYEYFVAVQYDENHTMFLSHEKAREMWNLSMSDGYRPILHGATPEETTV